MDILEAAFHVQVALYASGSGQAAIFKEVGALGNSGKESTHYIIQDSSGN